MSDAARVRSPGGRPMNTPDAVIARMSTEDWQALLCPDWNAGRGHFGATPASIAFGVKGGS
jgi:hypothetical protein